MKKAAAVVVSVFLLIGAVVWLGLFAQQTGAPQASVRPAVRVETVVAGQAATPVPTASGLVGHPPAGPRARPADARTWEAVTQAVIDSPDTAEVPDHAYAVVDIRVARSDRSWAIATLEPRDPSAFDGATAVLHLDGRTWGVKDLGSFDVGCGIAPKAVLGDLGLPCSPQ